MEMAMYIISILHAPSNVDIVNSWGAYRFRALKGEEGIIFHVQGYKFNGWVKIVYDEGADLFNIFYIDNKGQTQKIQNRIYFDQLVEVIDNEVEKTSDYEKRIMEQYSVVVLK